MPETLSRMFVYTYLTGSKTLLFWINLNKSGTQKDMTAIVDEMICLTIWDRMLIWESEIFCLEALK